MLHEDPLMSDINVDHWRNLQYLLLDSAKGKRRIIVIHDDGVIQKFTHSHRADINRGVVNRIERPQEDAQRIFETNPGKADFVVVLDRRSVDRYFGMVQDTWKSTEDLDEYVHRMFAALDQYPDGIAVYPGPARSALGLQWRLGASYEQVKEAIALFIPPSSSTIFGVFSGNELWASLILSFDENRRVNVVATAEPAALTAVGDWRAKARELVSWSNSKYARCSLGLFTTANEARIFLFAPNKLSALRKMAQDNQLLAEPAPANLTRLL
jgi:hypothetical protein